MCVRERKFHIWKGKQNKQINKRTAGKALFGQPGHGVGRHVGARVETRCHGGHLGGHRKGFNVGEGNVSVHCWIVVTMIGGSFRIAALAGDLESRLFGFSFTTVGLTITDPEARLISRSGKSLNTITSSILFSRDTLSSDTKFPHDSKIETSLQNSSSVFSKSNNNTSTKPDDINPLYIRHHHGPRYSLSKRRCASATSHGSNSPRRHDWLGPTKQHKHQHANWTV